MPVGNRHGVMSLCHHVILSLCHHEAQERSKLIEKIVVRFYRKKGSDWIETNNSIVLKRILFTFIWRIWRSITKKKTITMKRWILWMLWASLKSMLMPITSSSSVVYLSTCLYLSIVFLSTCLAPLISASTTPKAFGC